MLVFKTAAMAAFFIAVSGTVASADQTTTVSIPIGDIVGNVMGYVATGLSIVVVWALRFLPAQIYAIAMTARVDQLLGKAVAYGCNAVVGATRDKTLSFDVGNAVVKEALEYVLLHGAELVMKFAGEPIDIAEKIWARLSFDEATSKPDFKEIVVQASANIRTKV